MKRKQDHSCGSSHYRADREEAVEEPPLRGSLRGCGGAESLGHPWESPGKPEGKGHLQRGRGQGVLADSSLEFSEEPGG